MIPSQNSWEWLGAPKVVIIKGDSLRGQLATTFACQLDWGSRQTEQLGHGPLRSNAPLVHCSQDSGTQPLEPAPITFKYNGNG